jgi:histidyl-tRNA synthetase
MGGGSFKSQFKRADASGAQLAIVVGDDEAAAGAVTVKPLRAQGEQERVPLDAMADRIADLLYGADEETNGQ